MIRYGMDLERYLVDSVYCRLSSVLIMEWYGSSRHCIYSSINRGPLSVCFHVLL